MFTILHEFSEANAQIDSSLLTSASCRSCKHLNSVYQLSTNMPKMVILNFGYYWGMFHLCSKKVHKYSDRMTTFLQDRMVKKILFSFVRCWFGGTYANAHVEHWSGTMTSLVHTSIYSFGWQGVNTSPRCSTALIWWEIVVSLRCLNTTTWLFELPTLTVHYVEPLFLWRQSFSCGNNRYVIFCRRRI
jgi:hypothetical protein